MNDKPVKLIINIVSCKDKKIIELSIDVTGYYKSSHICKIEESLNNLLDIIDNCFTKNHTFIETINNSELFVFYDYNAKIFANDIVEQFKLSEDFINTFTNEVNKRVCKLLTGECIDTLSTPVTIGNNDWRYLEPEASNNYSLVNDEANYSKNIYTVFI